MLLVARLAERLTVRNLFSCEMIGLSFMKLRPKPDNPAPDEAVIFDRYKTGGPSAYRQVEVSGSVVLWLYLHSSTGD
jgi:hypothetical protein